MSHEVSKKKTIILEYLFFSSFALIFSYSEYVKVAEIELKFKDENNYSQIRHKNKSWRGYTRLPVLSAGHVILLWV